MTEAISVALPLFAMVLVGYLAVTRRLFTPDAARGLVAVVFHLFLPCFVFTKLVDVDLAALASGFDVLVPYYVAALIVLVVSVVTARMIWGHDAASAAIRGMASISGVVGYMGLPLILAVLGDRAALPTILLVTADNLVILVGGTLAMEVVAQRGRRDGISRIARRTLVAAAKNPIIVAVVLGIAALAFGVRLPAPMRFFANQFTAAAGPCALVALGAALATKASAPPRRAATRSVAEIRSNKSGAASELRDVGNVVALKVVVFPLLVYVLGRFVFPLSPLALEVAMLMSALPVAVNVFVLAVRYEAYVEQASRAMLFSTMLSLVVISGLLVALGH